MLERIVLRKTQYLCLSGGIACIVNFSKNMLTSDLHVLIYDNSYE